MSIPPSRRQRAASGRATPPWLLDVHAALGRAVAHRVAKPLVFLAALGPLAWYVWAAATDHLGANPQEALVRGLGDWTLQMLCATLAVTPLRTVTGWHALARWRRMLGLYTAFYMVLHLLAYAGFDKGFVLADILRDIAKRPFILVGSLAGLMLLPLAATSFNRAIRALGAKRWQALHRSVYVIAGLALLHFFWMKAGKHDFAEVAVYAAVIGVLLGWRVWDRVRPRQRVKTWRQPRGDGLIVKPRER